MAKETKVVTIQVKGIGVEAVVAGACVTRIIQESKALKIASIELSQNQVIVRSEHESTDELANWASSLEGVLKQIVATPKPMAKAPLPRSAEG